MTVDTSVVRDLARSSIPLFLRVVGAPLTTAYQGLARELAPDELESVRLAYALTSQGGTRTACVVGAGPGRLLISRKGNLPVWERVSTFRFAELGEYEGYRYNVLGRGVRFQAGFELSFDGRRGAAFAEYLMTLLAMDALGRTLEATLPGFAPDLDE